MEKVFAAALAICTALLFLIGYLYLYGYYNYYNIGMNELNLTIQDIAVHSFISIRYSLNSSWLLLLLIFSGVAIAVYLKFDTNAEVKTVVQTIGFLATFLLLIFAIQATRVGSRSAEVDTVRNPIVITGDAAVSKVLELFSGQSIWLRHLRTSDTMRYYLVQPRSGGTDKWVVRAVEDAIISIVYLDR